MTADKSIIIRARVPSNCADYLDKLCKAEHKSLSEIIRLIINERMLNDRMNSGPSKFEYYPAPTPRGRRASFKIMPEAEALATPSGCSALRASPTTCTGELTTNEAPEIVPEEKTAPVEEIVKIEEKTPEVRERPPVIDVQGADSPLFGLAFKGPSRPVYPGTLAEYEDALKHGRIKNGQFTPPNN